LEKAIVSAQEEQMNNLKTQNLDNKNKEMDLKPKYHKYLKESKVWINSKEYKEIQKIISYGYQKELFNILNNLTIELNETKKQLALKQKDLDSCKIQLKKHESLIQTNLKLKDIIMELLKNIKKENTKFKNDISLAIDKSEKKNEDSLTIDENIDIVGIRFILNVINIDNFTKEEKLIINHYLKRLKPIQK
jgi:hypothetical protein